MAVPYRLTKLQNFYGMNVDKFLLIWIKHLFLKSLSESNYFTATIIRDL